MQLERIAAGALTLAAALMIYTVLAYCSAVEANAFTVGVGDGAEYPAAPSAQLGAKAYRVVIDPAVPLETYDARIAAHRAVGQEPQLVIGGTGTINHASSRGIVRRAVETAKRWPSAYSIGVVNEPNESGMPVCEYARTFIAGYRSLRAMGVKRVLFGEWGPDNALGWQHATLTRCSHSSKVLRRMVGRVAWHGYGAAIDWADDFAAMTKRITGHTPALHVTEAGYTIHFHGETVSAAAADVGGVRYWRHAMKVARASLAQIVAWDVHSPTAGQWDSGLIDGHGRRRPAFGVIASAAR